MPHRLLISLLACGAFGACGSTPTTSTGAPSHVAGADRIVGDVDGDGTADAATLDLDGLTVAAGSLTYAYGALSGIDDAGDEIVAARVIDVGTEAVVALEHATIEDDARWEIIAVRGGALTLLGKVFIGGGEPTLPGNGTLIVTQRNCGQQTTSTVTVGAIALETHDEVTGYHGDAAATAAATRDGAFTVGDLARQDADGYLYLVARTHDLIISGGVNIYPREIEDRLTAHPAIADAAVVGAPDDEWGERVVAAIVVRPGEVAPSLDDVRAWCGVALAPYKRPRQLVVVASLPRNPTGKLDKRALRLSLSPTAGRGTES